MFGIYKKKTVVLMKEIWRKVLCVSVSVLVLQECGCKIRTMADNGCGW